MDVKEVRALVGQSNEDAVEQKLSFAYGNLACSTDHKPERRAFQQIAKELGWTEEQFTAWAEQRNWWLGRMHMMWPRRSSSQLTLMREDTVRMHGEPKGGFTCDTCTAKSTCTLVFDGYNTNGDCLAEK